MYRAVPLCLILVLGYTSESLATLRHPILHARDFLMETVVE